MRNINSILKGKKIDKKLEKLIEINCNLSAEVTNTLKATNKQNIAISALVETLVTVVKGTRFESEVNDIMSTCETYLYKD